ncbi:hypothetical protein IJ114_02120 [Candidatus Saccharibacteria bacterium]|nr:hypothetical protein [Candidatus Saccharibacteria bacterium]
MKKQSKKIGFLWILVWFLIYATYLVLAAIKETDFIATIFKYAGIILCFVYVLFNARSDVYLVIALGATVVADGILTINNVSLAGVVVFIMVQAAHLIRFTRIRAVSPIIPLIVTALIVGVGLLQTEISLMFVLAIAYGTLMFTNIYQALRWNAIEKSRASRLALFGFILFLMCDIWVGVSYVTTTATAPHLITMAANYIAWVFYLPAQVCIALSGIRVAEFEKAVELPNIDLDARAQGL